MLKFRLAVAVLAGLTLAPAASALPVDECAGEGGNMACVYLSPDGAYVSLDGGGDPGFVSLFIQGDPSPSVAGGVGTHVHGPEISAGAGFGAGGSGAGVVAFAESPETGCYYIDVSTEEPPFAGTCPF